MGLLEDAANEIRGESVYLPRMTGVGIVLELESCLVDAHFPRSFGARH